GERGSPGGGGDREAPVTPEVALTRPGWFRYAPPAGPRGGMAAGPGPPEPGKDGMESPYPSKLRVWEGAAAAVVPDPSLFPGPRGLPGPHHPSEFAERLFACEAFQPEPPARVADCGAEPYSLQWFLDIENHRHS